jgi:hypothetical protein
MFFSESIDGAAIFVISVKKYVDIGPAKFQGRLSGNNPGSIDQTF